MFVRTQDFGSHLGEANFFNDLECQRSRRPLETENLWGLSDHLLIRIRQLSCALIVKLCVLR